MLMIQHKVILSLSCLALVPLVLSVLVGEDVTVRLYAQSEAFIQNAGGEI